MIASLELRIENGWLADDRQEEGEREEELPSSDEVEFHPSLAEYVFT